MGYGFLGAVFGAAFGACTLTAAAVILYWIVTLAPTLRSPVIFVLASRATSHRSFPFWTTIMSLLTSSTGPVTWYVFGAGEGPLRRAAWTDPGSAAEPRAHNITTIIVSFLIGILLSLSDEHAITARPPNYNIRAFGATRPIPGKQFDRPDEASLNEL